MAKIISKKITPINGVGTVGYNVQFSVKDLYQLQYLAARVLDTCDKDTAQYELADTITTLFDKTVGGNVDWNWDFLKEESV